MSEKLNLQSRAKTKTFSFTDLDKPWGAGGQRFYIDAFGHEEDSVGGDSGNVRQEILDFGQIVFG